MALRPATAKSTNDDHKFTGLNNLSNGGKILFASDDFFAAAENLLKENNSEWKEGVFDPQGKWMDGWETRRKRIPGHDFCIIKLPHRSVIHGIHVDTSYFTGNHVPRISLQAGILSQKEETKMPKRTGETGKAASAEELKQVGELGTDKWKVIVPQTLLGAGYADTCDTFIPVQSRDAWTHLRLNYHPDGGVARLRVYGQVKRSLEDVNANGIAIKDVSSKSTLWDLASMEHGGICIGFSNAHYGHPRNMILQRPIPNIGDGWETARRLDRPNVIMLNSAGFMESPGQEWAAFRLAFVGKVVKIQVDTTCFKGNFPDSCKVEGCFVPENGDECQLLTGSESGGIWRTLVPQTKMGPDKTHMFTVDEKMGDKISHVRITMSPDGGIARLRVWGIAIQ